MFIFVRIFCFLAINSPKYLCFYTYFPEPFWHSSRCDKFFCDSLQASIPGGGGPSIDAMVSILFAARFAISISISIAVAIAAAVVGQIHIRFGHDWRPPRNLSPHCGRSNYSCTSGSTTSYLLPSLGARLLLDSNSTLRQLSLRRQLLLHFMLLLSKCTNVSYCFLLKTFFRLSHLGLVF